MKTEIDILKDVSGKLMDADIPFMLTGSMAMAYYAVPRMTRDLDIVVSLDFQKAGRMLDLFGAEYYISQQAVSESLQSRTLFNIIHNESVIKVDFIILKDESFRHAEFVRRRLIHIQDFDTYVVSKEDLILSKLIWARDTESQLQIRDVRNLIASGFDQEYVRFWLERLNLIQFFEKISI